jgi:hypothetical protein
MAEHMDSISPDDADDASARRLMGRAAEHPTGR